MHATPPRRAGLLALGLAATALVGGCQSPARNAPRDAAVSMPSLYGVSMAIGAAPQAVALQPPLDGGFIRTLETARVAAD